MPHTFISVLVTPIIERQLARCWLKILLFEDRLALGFPDFKSVAVLLRSRVALDTQLGLSFPDWRKR